MDPTKLKYILERAAQEEQIEQGERLQRGELSPQEAEAMRVAPDPQTRVLYELYRPLDDMEKHRLLRDRPRPRYALWTAVAAAAALVVVFLQKPLQPPPAAVALTTNGTISGTGPHMLGSNPSPTNAKPVIDIGGCAAPVLFAGARLPADTKTMVFFQRGSEIVFWPVELRYEPMKGELHSRRLCAPVPAAGLDDGDWQLGVIYGRVLPSQDQAIAALRGAFIMPWTRWNIARSPVRLQHRITP